MTLVTPLALWRPQLTVTYAISWEVPPGGLRSICSEFSVRSPASYDWHFPLSLAESIWPSWQLGYSFLLVGTDRRGHGQADLDAEQTHEPGMTPGLLANLAEVLRVPCTRDKVLLLRLAWCLEQNTECSSKVSLAFTVPWLYGWTTKVFIHIFQGAETKSDLPRLCSRSAKRAGETMKALNIQSHSLLRAQVPFGLWGVMDAWN